MIGYFEEELSLVHVDIFINSSEQVKRHLEYLIMYYQKLKKDALRKIKIIYMQYKLHSVYNNISKVLGFDETDSFYLNELVYYNEKLRLIDVFFNYQVKLFSVINEVDFIDIYKLSMLSNMQFCSNDKYLNAEIDSQFVEFNRRSRNLYRSFIYDRENEFSDTRDSFDDFFNYKYNQLTSSNTYKKML